jgi:hypothetical protein
VHHRRNQRTPKSHTARALTHASPDSKHTRQPASLTRRGGCPCPALKQRNLRLAAQAAACPRRWGEASETPFGAAGAGSHPTHGRAQLQRPQLLLLLPVPALRRVPAAPCAWMQASLASSPGRATALRSWWQCEASWPAWHPLQQLRCGWPAAAAPGGGGAGAGAAGGGAPEAAARASVRRSSGALERLAPPPGARPASAAGASPGPHIPRA